MCEVFDGGRDPEYLPPQVPVRQFTREEMTFIAAWMLLRMDNPEPEYLIQLRLVP
jgi:hypothetical protein